jgi:ectoine hydroxylase
MSNVLNAAQTAEFNEKGFAYARGLFAPDEVKLLTDAMEQDPAGARQHPRPARQ